MADTNMSERITADELEALRRAFERVSARGWGVSLGLLAALGLFVATSILVIKGGPDAGAHLGLLSNYFPGFDITFAGAAVGAAYGLVVGDVAGWSVGAAYNFFVDRV
ncbi:MAG: hypothetical protein ABL982_05570 [Vicinamibacterales bacterium]